MEKVVIYRTTDYFKIFRIFYINIGNQNIAAYY